MDVTHFIQWNSCRMATNGHLFSFSLSFDVWSLLTRKMEISLLSIHVFLTHWVSVCCPELGLSAWLSPSMHNIFLWASSNLQNSSKAVII